MRGLLTAAGDLLFGSRCAGCQRQPGLLCVECRPFLCSPAEVQVVPGSTALRVASVSDYSGVPRSVILDHKEKGRLSLARPLGDALAVSVSGLLESGFGCLSCGSRSVALVPAPSRPAAVRSRGHDPVARMARRAAMLLRRTGQACSVAGALSHARPVLDQSELTRDQRETNVHGAFNVRGLCARCLEGRCVVVVDDIVTSGATLREAARALGNEGHRVCGAAVVAAVT